MDFKIVKIERTLPEGLCTVAHWTATKTDGDYTGSGYGVAYLPAKDPSDPTFIPYEQITEAQAVQWVKEALGQDEVDAIEAGLNDQIEAQKNPTKASGLPWA
jgi:hypothetical protein